jgi:hypothetical protein
MLRLLLFRPSFASVGALGMRGRGEHDRSDRAERGVGLVRQTVVDWRQAAGFAKRSDCRVELVHHNQPGGVVDRCPVDRAHKTNQLRGLQISKVFEHAEQLAQRSPVRSCEHRLAFLAMPGAPGAYEPRVVDKFWSLRGVAFHYASHTPAWGNIPATGGES